MSAIVIPGFTDSDKVPGAVLETLYGQGKQSIGAQPVVMVCTGNKTSAGSAVADQDIVQVFTENDADAFAGAGSEGACQLYAALQIPGVTLFYAPVAEAASSPASATLTITIGGTWTAIGTVTVRLAGRKISIATSATDTTTTVATALAAAINGTPRLPMSASSSSAVVTVTVLSKGTRGNDYVCATDKTTLASGMTVTLAGGTALTGGVTPFSGGAGADSVVNVLALLATQTWDFQAWAQNDATNAALIKTQLESQAGPLVQHPGFAVFGKTRTTGTSISFAQTTLNEPLAAVVHHTNSESHPCVIAAQVAAVFATTVAANPNRRYVSYVLPSIAPQSQKADIPGRATLNALLNAGVTPLTTRPDGSVVIVDAIQSHSLNGSSADFRTYHVGDVFVPIRVSKEIGAQWDVFSAANPYVGPDPADGEQPAPEGVATPALWIAELVALLKSFEAQNWLQSVDQNLPIAEYNTVSKRLMSAVPNVVRSQNIQLG